MGQLRQPMQDCAADAAGRLCRVCLRKAPRYTCPRCEVPYCSLDCYRRHNNDCTESFFQYQVKEELRSERASGAERRRLEGVLAGLANLGDPAAGCEDSEDEDEGDGASDGRLEQLADRALRDELSLEDLTPEEAGKFHSELRRGQLGRALGAWEPWWARAAVAVVQLDELDDEPALAECSQPSRPSPPALMSGHICCAPQRPAHPAVAFSSLEALYAYVHTMRAFNGEWQWDPLQVASHMLHLSRAARTTHVYESATEALRAAIRAAAALPGGGFGRELDTRCISDVATVLRRSPDSVGLALGEAAAVAQEALLALANGDEKAPARLQRGARKLEFLASFAAHHCEALEALVGEVCGLHELLSAEAKAAADAAADGGAAAAAVRLGGVVLPPRT